MILEKVFEYVGGIFLILLVLSLIVLLVFLFFVLIESMYERFYKKFDLWVYALSYATIKKLKKDLPINEFTVYGKKYKIVKLNEKGDEP